MKRKIEADLVAWKEKEGHKPLLVFGGRQVGKTYSITEFAKKAYSRFIYINFEKQPEKKSIFSESLDARYLCERIQEYEGVTLDKDSVIVLDEIGYCKNAFSSLKSFAEERMIDVIASGSMLGIVLDRTKDGRISPMGFVDAMEMFPMDFEEFLWAAGVSEKLINELKTSILEQKKIDEYLLDRISEYFRYHVIIGGMPEAVSKYIETRSYVQARKTLEDILLILRSDMKKYSGAVSCMKIDACLGSLPRQLASNPRFQYKDVEMKKGAMEKHYATALEWLKSASILDQCNNLTEPVAPLPIRERSNSFRMYCRDTGILLALMDYDDARRVLFREPSANLGPVMENAVAGELVKRGYPLRYYLKPNSTLELDFVISIEGSVTAIGVKSGKSKNAKSLRTAMSGYKGLKGIKLSESNVFVDENGILCLPLFAPCFFPCPRSELPPMTEPGDLDLRPASHP